MHENVYCWGKNSTIEEFKREYKCILLPSWSVAIDCDVIPFLLQNDDYRMREIMHLAHEFLQHFCHNNHTNQGLLHRHLDLFLQSGDNVRVWMWCGCGCVRVWVCEGVGM